MAAERGHLLSRLFGNGGLAVPDHGDREPPPRDRRDVLEERPYTIKEVADYFRIHEKTLYKYVAQGNIKAFRIGKKWVIPREEVKRIADQWKK